MIERKKRKVNSWMKSEIKKDAGDDPTVDDVLYLLLGDSEGGSGADYVVYKYSKAQKRTPFNRINMLWVWPLIVVCLPLQWLLTGETGVKRSTKLGKVVHWLVKFDE